MEIILKFDRSKIFFLLPVESDSLIFLAKGFYKVPPIVRLCNFVSEMKVYC